jgi:hypothetical protein
MHLDACFKFNEATVYYVYLCFFCYKVFLGRAISLSQKIMTANFRNRASVACVVDPSVIIFSIYSLQQKVTLYIKVISLDFE